MLNYDTSYWRFVGQDSNIGLTNYNCRRSDLFWAVDRDPQPTMCFSTMFPFSFLFFLSFFFFFCLIVNNTCANGLVTHAGHVFKSYFDEMILSNFLEVGIWLEWGGWGYVGMRF